MQSAKKVVLDFTGRGQRSAKDKQTEGVGVHRYGSPSVCAVSQNALRCRGRLRHIGSSFLRAKLPQSNCLKSAIASPLLKAGAKA